jgi:cell division septal protein FtsQ
MMRKRVNNDYINNINTRFVRKRVRRFFLRIIKNKFFWLFTLLIFTFSGLVYLFLFSDFFQIKSIQIKGAVSQKPEEIKNLIEKEIINNLLGFKTKSIFLVKNKNISQVILNKYPEIEYLKIKKVMPFTLDIFIEERKGVGVLCSEFNCFLFDKNGVIFKEVEKSKIDLVDFIFKLDLENEDLFLSKKIFDEETIEKVLQAKDYLVNNLALKPKESHIYPSKKRFDIKLKEGWEIYFSLSNKLDWQLVSLKSVLEKGISPEKKERLKYIDLRFNNVFVSFK